MNNSLLRRWARLFGGEPPSVPTPEPPPPPPVTAVLSPSPLPKAMPRMMPNLQVTLWPAFPHFRRFSQDRRIQGIRLNSAMMDAAEIDDDFEDAINAATVPLWFDVKAMQLRIREVVCDTNCDHIEFRLNRPIECETPCLVWFKAGEDCARLLRIEDGNHLIFEAVPQFEIREGESIHIRDPKLKVGGPVMLDYEIEKVQRAMELGFDRFYLSYVYSQQHVDEFRAIVGDEADVVLKIENQAGLRWVQDEYVPQPNTRLAAARGDLFIEIEYPHEIMTACKTILAKDPRAIVGSRMLLSCIHDVVPSCSDLNEIAWLYDVGYRNFLLCDELCLKEDLLHRAVSVFDAFRHEYVGNPKRW